MRNSILFLWLSIFCVVGQAQVPGAKIESVGLFKNGLTVVHLSGSIPEGGRLEFENLPLPVHGTFAIISEKPVTARVELQMTDSALDQVTQADLLQNLSGQKVTLHLEKDTISGEVMGAPQKTLKQWNRNYLPQNNSYYPFGDIRISGQPSGMTFIKTAEGKVIAVMLNQILRIEFDEMPKIQRERPVFSLSSAAPGRFEMDYLTKGLAWVPSYRIDLGDPKTLSITQSAVIRNELADLKDVEIRLISGFPSVQFGAVDSPLSAQTTWKSFFDQLANRSTRSYNAHDNSGITQQISFNRGAPAGAALAPADEGESVDLHYQPIGRHTLGTGEAFSTDVARAETAYQRVVEWNVPDTRTVDGRTIPDHQWQETMELTPWDAIVFKNPFPFPMTTGPALVVKGADFQGQQLATWTNPGSETSIRINKALSVSTRSVENEVPDSRVKQRLGGSNFYQVKVKGELTVKNHRGNPAAMVVRRQFSGNLMEADLNPTLVLLESGVYSINKRNELKWSLELKPGEEKSLTYLYEVLVRD